jgi:hypothetical protein
MLTEQGATLSQFAGEAIGCKRLPNDVVLEMEDPRCKSLLNRVVLEIEDPRCNRVAIRMKDPRCESLLMIW